MIDYNQEVWLNAISAADPKELLKWRNSQAIYQWCRQFEPLNAWDHADWIASLKSRKDVRMYSIEDSTVGTHVGVCGLTSIDMINRRAEFSLYIDPDQHRHGYGRGALITLCAHAFLSLGLNHVFGESFDGNPAVKMFEQVGFKLEGTRRGFYFRDGKFIDAHLYSILAAEFRTKWSL